MTILANIRHICYTATQCKCWESQANWPLNICCTYSHVESKLNLTHFLWPVVYLPISTNCRGEIGVTPMAKDKCWIFCRYKSVSPHSALLKVALEKLMRNCGWRGARQIAFKSFHLCCSSVWAREKEGLFFSSRFLERASDRNTETETADLLLILSWFSTTRSTLRFFV